MDTVTAAADLGEMAVEEHLQEVGEEETVEVVEVVEEESDPSSGNCFAVRRFWDQAHPPGTADKALGWPREE